jgi:hypothetical protein
MCVPGSPSLVGRKPGKIKYKKLTSHAIRIRKLVTLSGLEGSNPSPGALIEFNAVISSWCKGLLLYLFLLKLTIEASRYDRAAIQCTLPCHYII